MITKSMRTSRQFKRRFIGGGGGKKEGNATIRAGGGRGQAPCSAGPEPLEGCARLPAVNAQFTILRDPGNRRRRGFLAMSIRRDDRAIARGANPGAALILGTLLLLTRP